MHLYQDRAIFSNITCCFNNYHPISEPYEMSTQGLPAASLRTAKRLPAAQGLAQLTNYLIYMTLWSIRMAISGIESSFSPCSQGGTAGRLAVSVAQQRRGRRRPRRHKPDRNPQRLSFDEPQLYRRPRHFGEHVGVPAPPQGGRICVGAHSLTERGRPTSRRWQDGVGEGVAGPRPPHNTCVLFRYR